MKDLLLEAYTKGPNRGVYIGKCPNCGRGQVFMWRGLAYICDHVKLVMVGDLVEVADDSPCDYAEEAA